MLDKSSEGAGKDKSLREQEKRRKKYKYALVKYEWPFSGYGMEYKPLLTKPWIRAHTILCDDQPEKVLRGMLKLMKEQEDG